MVYHATTQAGDNDISCSVDPIYLKLGPRIVHDEDNIRYQAFWLSNNGQKVIAKPLSALNSAFF
jgi:hypothetical protein